MSAFRFLPSSSGKRGSYSVWRGERQIGHVVRNTYRLGGKTYETGWSPTTADGRDLPTERTREMAARVLWADWQASGR